MKLLEEDEKYLTSKEFTWEFISGSSEGYLIIKNYPVNSSRFTPSQTTIMIRIPAGYNIAALDCFYADPPLKLKADGSYPQAAGQFPVFIDKPWQQFSRHFTNTPWRPGVDSIQTILAHITKELQSV